LIIDSDTVLAGTIALESFEAITGWNHQVMQPSGDFKLAKLASSHRREMDETANVRASGEQFRIRILE
jgi:hypothetical protein